MNRRFVWTPEKVALLVCTYPDTTAAEIAGQLGTMPYTVYRKAHALKLTKSAAFLASAASGRLQREAGISTRFVKGQASWNKGKPHPARGRSIETQFKPGVRQGVAVKLYKPVGSERISKDGYLERKINDGMPLNKRWRAVHIVEWEAVNGPLPAGHALVFRDGNKQHISLDNLELITRAELMRRNSYHQYGQDIAQLVQLRGAITRQINKRERKAQ